MRKLFLDDIRTVDMVYEPNMVAEFDVVRSYAEFVSYIIGYGSSLPLVDNTTEEGRAKNRRVQFVVK